MRARNNISSCGAYNFMYTPPPRTYAIFIAGVIKSFCEINSVVMALLIIGNVWPFRLMRVRNAMEVAGTRTRIFTYIYIYFMRCGGVGMKRFLNWKCGCRLRCFSCCGRGNGNCFGRDLWMPRAYYV